MAEKNHHLTVSLSSALCSVTRSPTVLLDKLASVAAPEADIGRELVHSLCDISLLDSLHLDTSEQELVLKAVIIALQEKLDYIPRDVNSGPTALGLLLYFLCIVPIQGTFGFGEFGERFKLFNQLSAQIYGCELVLRKVQRQLADEKSKQQSYEQLQEPLLSCVVRSAPVASNSHLKCS